MSRSGYSDCLDDKELALYRGRVANTLKGKRSQAFLRELAAALDAMPEKRLISGKLIDADGECCAIGAVCKARGLDVSGVDPEVPEQVARAVGISSVLAAEIEFENDEDFCRWEGVTPEKRWKRMRQWVDKQIREEVAP